MCDAGGGHSCQDVRAPGGSSNGRTSGFGPENRGSNPCPPAQAPRANSILAVAGPTVLILAAGKGVRMRSSKPKGMPGLCGRPMVLWPVQAALEAGAGSIVVVDSPERTLQAVLPDGVELAVQERADGTGGAVAAALSHLERPAPDGPPASPGPDPRAPVLVL